MDASKVARRSEVSDLAALLDLPEIKQFITSFEETRWTGRPGYQVRTMVGLLLTKSLFALPTWTRVISLVRDHSDLREVLDCIHDEEMPSIHAIYRFTKKLLAHGAMLDQCIRRVQSSLRKVNPEYGENLAIDGSDLPAYANGMGRTAKGGRERRPEEYSDADAHWGRRSAISTRNGGQYYGYKLHHAICTDTELPVDWIITPANHSEKAEVAPLLDQARAKGFAADTCSMDNGYDAGYVYETCEERNCRPLIPLSQATIDTGRHRPPQCEHGTWEFRGAEYDRKTTKWVCPTGECNPKTKRIKASRLHTMIPRGTGRWWDLYRKRSAIERGFGRLKHEWGLTPLRVRGLERVRLHVNLTMLTMLGCALLRI